ncbi:MAG: carbohydrate kinase family protein [Alphaproteobacteria bacterium]|nr:carbohydrate kinase family protein [Alphaproteobacteria bacterium]
MKAITVGSATVDVIATVPSADIERMTLQNRHTSFLLLEPGKKVDARSVVRQTGGGAVNAAVSLSRQGFQVAALVKLGSDPDAETILSRLREEGIDTGLVRHSATETTAVSVMIASHDRNAAIFTHRGANRTLEDADVPAEAFTGADLVYVTNLSNASVERFPDILARAKAAGAFVAVNPGILQLTRRTTDFFDNLRNADLFTCNFDEARALVPTLVDRMGWDRRHVQSQDQGPLPELAIEGFHLPLEDYFKRVHNHGPRFVAVTMGGDGAYLSDAQNGVHFEPTLKVEVVGTAGAGDAFASTLAGSLVRGLPIADAARLAARNAASVVSFIDTQTGLLRLDALEADQ